MLNKAQKLLLGIVLLVLVDVIWVSSSELTKVGIDLLIVGIRYLSMRCICFQFLYDDEKYDKPFFCTYFKSSMFTIYLVFLGLIAPWKESCNRNGNYAV